MKGSPRILLWRLVLWLSVPGILVWAGLTFADVEEIPLWITLLSTVIAFFWGIWGATLFWRKEVEMEPQ